MYILMDTRNVEQTKDVRMYTCRIYSSRDLDTLLHKVELNLKWITLEKCWFIYTRSNRREM